MSVSATAGFDSASVSIRSSSLLAQRTRSTVANTASAVNGQPMAIRDTASQTGLSRQERTDNIKGAFDVRGARKIKALSIVLVDDVITSTATVREATATLVRAGAKSVEVIALARATDSVAPLAPASQKS